MSERRASNLQISLACVRDMLEVVLAYVPAAQRETARAAGLAIGIGHAIDADKPKRKAGHTIPGDARADHSSAGSL
jgi:hypothetical protein